jgi:hypothetical protein
VDGTLNINNATNTYSLSGGAISGSSLTGSGTINGNVNAVSTNVLPGDSVAGVVTPGRLTINGNYSQTGGEFEAALGSSTSYSQLSVSGTATVGGAATIGVELYNGFVPTVGESFGVIAGSSVSAAWTNPTSGLGLISDSTGGYDFKVSDTAAAVSLIYEGVAGSSATVPVLPSSTVGQGFLFENLQNGVWIDPTLTSGYELQTTNGALFTSIVLPTGYSDPFVITVGNALLGDYGPGSTVNFSSIYPGGVSEFTITGIHPEVDSSDPDAFAVQTYFNESGADVEMTPFSGSAAAPRAQANKERRSPKGIAPPSGASHGPGAPPLPTGAARGECPGVQGALPIANYYRKRHLPRPPPTLPRGVATGSGALRPTYWGGSGLDC